MGSGIADNCSDGDVYWIWNLLIPHPTSSAQIPQIVVLSDGLIDTNDDDDGGRVNKLLNPI